MKLGSRGLQLLGGVVEARDSLGLGQGSTSSSTFTVIVLFLLWVADTICFTRSGYGSSYILITFDSGKSGCGKLRLLVG